MTGLSLRLINTLMTNWERGMPFVYKPTKDSLENWLVPNEVVQIYERSPCWLFLVRSWQGVNYLFCGFDQAKNPLNLHLYHVMSRIVPTPKIVTKSTESAVPRGIFGNEIEKYCGGQRGSNPGLPRGRAPLYHCTKPAWLLKLQKSGLIEIRPKLSLFHSGHRLIYTKRWKVGRATWRPSILATFCRMLVFCHQIYLATIIILKKT